MSLPFMSKRAECQCRNVAGLISRARSAISLPFFNQKRVSAFKEILLGFEEVEVTRKRGLIIPTEERK